jgi:hypothetical protein
MSRTGAAGGKRTERLPVRLERLTAACWPKVTLKCPDSQG